MGGSEMEMGQMPPLPSSLFGFILTELKFLFKEKFFYDLGRDFSARWAWEGYSECRFQGVAETSLKAALKSKF